MRLFKLIATMIMASVVLSIPAFADVNHLNNLNGKTTEFAETLSQRAKVSLNKASVRELIKVKGIKPNHARALVMYRKRHGDFKSVEDIAKVKGFKRMKTQNIKQIQDQLTL